MLTSLNLCRKHDVAIAVISSAECEMEAVRDWSAEHCSAKSLTFPLLNAKWRAMSELVYPRSPRETMDGWMHLPRYVDKIRLHLAGKLHPDYQNNFSKGFDGMWLQAAGLAHEQFVEVVKHSITDGQVCDWVRQNVKRTLAEKAAHREEMLSRPKPGDAAALERFLRRKEEANCAHRDDVRTFVDLIDADEKRT